MSLQKNPRPCTLEASGNKLHMWRSSSALGGIRQWRWTEQ